MRLIIEHDEETFELKVKLQSLRINNMTEAYLSNILLKSYPIIEKIVADERGKVYNQMIVEDADEGPG